MPQGVARRNHPLDCHVSIGQPNEAKISDIAFQSQRDDRGPKT